MASQTSGKTPQSLQLGHGAVKSGPLCVTSSKLVSQKIVLDNMLAHYNKVSKAKPAIDNKPPQSMLQSTKVRDRLRREALLKSANTPRARSAVTSRGSQGSQGGERDALDFGGATGSSTMDRKVSSARTSGATGNLGSYRESSRANGTQLQSRPQPADSAAAQPVEVELPTGSGRRSHTTPQSADIIDKRPQSFKPGGQFTPRTLNTRNAQSWLSKSKFYTPPRKRPAKNAGDDPAARDQYDGNDQYAAQDDLEDVPPLNISVDDDKMRWLREQAQLARSRKDTTETYDAKLLNQDASLRRSTDSQLRQSQSFDNTESLRRSIEAGGAGYKTFSGSSRQSKTMALLSREEEELRYLEFVSDVTNDIVSRGVYTNAALNHIFEYHVQKRKDILKISRMRSMLDGLRDDLGIPVADEEGVENYGYGGTSPENSPDKSYLPRGGDRKQQRAKAAAATVEVDGDSTVTDFVDVAESRKVDLGRPNLESTRADEPALERSYLNQTTESTLQSTQQSEIGAFTMTLGPSHLQTLMQTGNPRELTATNGRKLLQPNETPLSSKDGSVQGTPQRRNSAAKDIQDLTKAYEETLTMKLQDEMDGEAPGPHTAPKSVTFADKPDFIGTASLGESFDFTRVSDMMASQSNPLSATQEEQQQEEVQQEELGETGFGNDFGSPGRTGNLALLKMDPGMTGKPGMLPAAAAAAGAKDDEDEATYAEDFDEES